MNANTFLIICTIKKEPALEHLRNAVKESSVKNAPVISISNDPYGAVWLLKSELAISEIYKKFHPLIALDDTLIITTVGHPIIGHGKDQDLLWMKDWFNPPSKKL
ncbi:MAG TPA: hypothetical protein VFA55_01665 [Candidatus Kapabacteria bacterium]|nr:hypothetical protein [Candidatus Kapabacteria bacterium]